MPISNNLILIIYIYNNNKPAYLIPKFKVKFVSNGKYLHILLIFKDVFIDFKLIDVTQKDETCKNSLISSLFSSLISSSIFSKYSTKYSSK